MILDIFYNNGDEQFVKITNVIIGRQYLECIEEHGHNNPLKISMGDIESYILWTDDRNKIITQQLKGVKPWK